jgi:biotin carboxylase
MNTEGHSDRHGEGHVVIVDGYAAAKELPPAFARAGHPTVRVQSTAEVPLVYRGGLDLGGYVANIVHEGDLDQTLKALAGYQPVAVLPGGELGVELADALSEALGLPTSNGTALSAARRDKYTQIERVRASGLLAARQLLIEDDEQLRAWHEETGGRIVVKPVRSAAGDGVSFCDTPEQAVRAYRTLLGRENVFSLRNEGVVAQEYLVGSEFMVNTVSRDGVHHLTDIWRTGRLSVNGVTDLAVENTLVDAGSSEAVRLCAYAFQVLDALGIQHGPGHLEIKLTPKGACLIEAGARISGGDLPAFTALSTGESQVDWIVDAYVNPERFHARSDRSYEISRYFAWAAMASPVEGVLKGFRGLDQVRALESFRELRVLVQPGERIRRTVDDLSNALMLTLQHDVEEVVLRDLNTVRYLDGAGFYELEAP